MTKYFWNNRLLFEDYPIIFIRSVRCKVSVFWYLFMFNISLSRYIRQILWMWVLIGVMLEKMGTQSAQQAWEPMYCLYKCWYELNKNDSNSCCYMCYRVMSLCWEWVWLILLFCCFFTNLWFWLLRSLWTTRNVLSQVINLFLGYCSSVLLC